MRVDRGYKKKSASFYLTSRDRKYLPYLVLDKGTDKRSNSSEEIH